MKGIILAGGTGSRLLPITKITNKHLLPVYNQPMIYYPLQTLLRAGIHDIMIISGPDHAGDFLRLLGSGKDFGCRFTYEIQDEALGIANALAHAEWFADNDNITAILGDNFFEDDFSEVIRNFTNGAHIFLKKVDKVNRFGVAEVEGSKVIAIEEKPENPKTNYAVTGLYIYDPSVFDIIRALKPSERGEFEITDVSNVFIKQKKLTATFVKNFWSDMGTFESMYAAIQKAQSFAVK